MKIFISYRRADSKYVVDRIRDRLILAFGNQSVFRDIESIPIGVDFRTELESVASSCDVMLVVVGPQWAGITDAQGNKRLFDPNDFTRIEIETGLNHEGIRVVPVLVMKAFMPTTQEMPESLQELAFRNAINVRNDPDFDNDIQRLIIGINQLPGSGVDTTSNEPIVDILASSTKAEKPLESRPAREKSAAGKSAQKKFPLMLGILGGLTLMIVAVIAGFFLTRNKPSPITSTGMVRVPAGNYKVGTNTPVDLAEFWIDRYEITNSDYAKFIEGTRNDPPKYWVNNEIPAGLRNHPVRQINWNQAEEYCNWVGERLPTEAEWEIAARGPFGWLYPWGNKADLVKQETESARPVSSNPANRSYFGAYYMSGNVREWVSNPYTSTNAGEHILRGGAYGPRDVLTTAISVADNSPATDKAGFRCAANSENVIQQYPEEDLALDDNFSSNTTKWPSINADNFLLDYHEVGFYHVEIRESNKFIPAFYEHGTYSNFVMETGVFVDKANTDNQQGDFLYGLGVQVTDDQFYAFVISGKDQSWQVLKGILNKDALEGNASDLAVIKSGMESSIGADSMEQEVRLTVIANGTEFMYYVNGDLVYVFNVGERQNGNIGFVVETLDNVKRVHIHYNWVTLQKIERFENGGENQTTSAIQTTPIIAPTLTSSSAPPTSSTVEIPKETEMPLTPANLSDGKEMVKIGSDTYEVGTTPADEYHIAPKSIHFDSFWIDKYQVANARYQQYLDQTGNPALAATGKENHPVIGVTWDQANAYCSWVNKRLPTEVEWEVAGRGPGPNPQLYPWGNDPTDGGKASALPNQDTYEVGTLPFNISPSGVFDLVGNVWEWVGDPYNSVQEGYHILRGGRYGNFQDLAYRLTVAPDDTSFIKYAGFRCAADQIK